MAWQRRPSLPHLPVTGINPCKHLVGIGTDGASANIAAASMKGLVEKELPWVFRLWCLGHRVELAIKDALSHTSFELIDEMLLRLYYIYEKSPKKCRQLEEIIDDIKNCLTFDDKGIKPVRASGSRWVTHKLNAMKRVLSKYGAYTNHLTALSEDSSVKSNDQGKLRGYCHKWVNAKYLLGCAFYMDFPRYFRSDDLDVLAAFMSLLRTVKEINKLSSLPLEKWPTLKKILLEDGERAYQCQSLQNYDQAKNHYTAQYRHLCVSVTDCLKSRLAWSDLQLIRDVIFVLATQGWEKVLDVGDDSGDENSDPPMEAIVRLGVRFKHPLESNGVIEQLKDEFHDMITYANQFISLATMDYQAVWWRVYHAPNASSWSTFYSSCVKREA